MYPCPRNPLCRCVTSHLKINNIYIDFFTVYFFSFYLVYIWRGCIFANNFANSIFQYLPYKCIYLLYAKLAYDWINMPIKYGSWLHRYMYIIPLSKPKEIKNWSSDAGIAVYTEIERTYITDVWSTSKFIQREITVTPYIKIYIHLFTYISSTRPKLVLRDTQNVFSNLKEP